MIQKNTFLTTVGHILNIKCSECARWTGITNPPQTERNHWYCAWCGSLLKPYQQQSGGDSGGGGDAGGK